MKNKTVVKIEIPVVDDEGNYVDYEGEPVSDPVMQEELFYLLHWGLHMEILEDQRTDQRYPVSYTVGICQHMKSGVIKVFAPEMLTVIGIDKPE